MACAGSPGFRSATLEGVRVVASFSVGIEGPEWGGGDGEGLYALILRLWSKRARAVVRLNIPKRYGSS